MADTHAQWTLAQLDGKMAAVISTVMSDLDGKMAAVISTVMSDLATRRTRLAANWTNL